MKKTLGIDLGSNSLGWAILDDISLDVVDKGVVVFPEGVDLDAGSSLETRAAVRRAARMGRRMKFRRKMRKWHLLDLLIDAKMCPLSKQELGTWQRQGVYPVSNREFLEWLKATDVSNPYCDRDAAARGKVAPLVLGRALYHLCQRRGFKSSRKDEAALVDEETGELKREDKLTGAVKSDIVALSKEIRDAGCRTLGQYFFMCLQREKDRKAKSRIRCRYTGRTEHYESEFGVIMDAQGFAKDDDLRKKLHNAIFMQRPLRSQKHLVGNCPLEPRNARAQIGHPAVEEFTMWAFVNNLTLEDEDGNCRDDDGNLLYPLTPADCAMIVSAVASVKKPTFKTIYKAFRKDSRFAKKKLRFHYYEEDDAVPSCPTRSRIAEAFGDVAYDEQKVFDALTFYNDTELLKSWFRKHYPSLDERSIAKLVAIHPKEGNARYSLKAINRILPFLRRGFELSHARFCAKLQDVVPEYKSREDEVLLRMEETYRLHRREKRERAETVSQIRKNLPDLPTLHERYAQILRDEFGVADDRFERLYLRNDDTYAPETSYRNRGETVTLERPRLPPVRLGMIRNPLVQRAMTTLRRLVNYLAEHGKLDTSDTIRIELARSVNDFATRKAYQEWQKGRAAVREKAAAEIAKYGKAVTEDALERYVLADEQGWTCLYTGRKIGIADLLDGNSFDIEHTLPRSLSGDDALANKTICDAAYNRRVKRGRVPKECPNWEESAEGYGAIEVRLRPWRERLDELEKTCRNQLKKAKVVGDPAAKCAARVKALVTKMERDYWRDKLRRFDMAMDRLTVHDGEGLGFKRRQLVDTGIMCTHAVDLLKCLYPKTFAVNGAATAFARKAWGVQSDAAKDRSEHTHHAKDAMVIAALTPARFTAICTALKDDGAQAAKGRECDVCPPPCEGFADKVRLASEEILVKHVLRQTTLRQSMKRTALAHAHPQKGDPEKTVKHVLSKGDTVRGQLHKDTSYGCIKNPITGNREFVVRKSLIGPITGISGCEKWIDKIIDPVIRKIVMSTVADLKQKGVKNLVSGMICMPSGVPVNKVRIRSRISSPYLLRQHAFLSGHQYKRSVYVSSSPNFRLAIYEKKGRYSYETESALTWSQEHKKSTYVPLNMKEGFVGYVLPGAMLLAHGGLKIEKLRDFSISQLRKRLYYVRVLPSESDNHAEIQHHLEAIRRRLPTSLRL